MEYRIESMRRTEEGWHVATVRSFYDQKTYTLHDRYGSWFIGDPYAKDAIMREPAVISSNLPFDLQDYKNGKGGSNVEAPRENPFLKKAKDAANPFLKKAAATPVNPFINKAKKGTA